MLQQNWRLSTDRMAINKMPPRLHASSYMPPHSVATRLPRVSGKCLLFTERNMICSILQHQSFTFAEVLSIKALLNLILYHTATAYGPASSAKMSRYLLSSITATELWDILPHLFEYSTIFDMLNLHELYLIWLMVTQYRAHMHEGHSFMRNDGRHSTCRERYFERRSKNILTNTTAF